MSRRSRRHLGRALAAVFGPAWFVAPAAAWMLAAPAGFAAVARNPMEVLADGSASDRARQAAADDLILRADESIVRDAMTRELARPIAGSGGGRYILSAISRSADPSARLFPILTQRVQVSAPDELPTLLDALASFRSRDAARLILLHCEDRGNEGVAPAAFAALRRLTGRDDLPSDPARWEAWMRDVDQWSEVQWRGELAAAHALRARRLEAEHRELGIRLVDSLRRLHLATPAPDRPALLASMMTDSVPAVRDTGLELAAREVAASGSLGPAVGEAALQLLGSPEAAVRASAATLVRQLDPEGAAPLISEALAREQDPVAAVAMLAAAARWPSQSDTAPALAWLRAGSTAAAPAADLVWSLYRAGELNPDAQSDALSLVRAWPDSQLTPAACRVLSTLGEDSDRRRLVPLLGSSSAALRQAAAESLLWEAEYLPAIIAAARRDVDLFDVAGRALLVHEPTAPGLNLLLQLPRPAPETAQTAILRLARGLPANELWTVISSLRDPVLRRLLLESLTMEERQMSERLDPVRLGALGKGVLAIAELELTASRPDAALRRLEASPFFGENAAAGPEGFDDLRCACLVALNRPELATQTPGSAAAWLRGVTIAQREPFAGSLIAVMEQKFADTLSESELQDLAALKTRLAAKPPE